MIRLQLKYKETLIKEVLVDKGEITIGRDSRNDLQIDNLAVSSKHARIFKHPKGYAIEDLKSTNGTYVNNKRIKSKLLSHDDQIAIGKHTIVVLQGDKADIKGSKSQDATYVLDAKEIQKMIKKK